MADIRALDSELNAMILKGQGMEAFEKFYADDCIMQENTDDPRVGKDACRKYEEDFMGNIAEFHGAELLNASVDGERSYSEWVFDCSFKDGTRMRNTQVAARTWSGGQIAKEQFFYKPNLVKA